MPATLNHTGIVVADLDRALDFYCDGLGLHPSIVVDAGSEALSQLLGYPNVKVRAAFVSSVDGYSVELIEYKNPPGERRDPKELHKRAAIGACHVSFIVDDVQATYQRLLKKGGKKLNPPVQLTPDLKSVYLQDPDGNWVELDEDKAHARFPFRIVQNTAILPANPAPTKTTL